MTKLYWIDFEFMSGGFSVPFCHTVEARNPVFARRKAHQFLAGFYGVKGDASMKVDGESWSYFDGEATMTLISIQEMQPIGIVTRLLI